MCFAFRFPTLTALVDPELVGKRLCGCGPVLHQRLVLLWGKETSLLVSKETWMLELPYGSTEFIWRKVSQYVWSFLICIYVYTLVLLVSLANLSSLAGIADSLLTLYMQHQKCIMEILNYAFPAITTVYLLNSTSMFIATPKIHTYAW